MAESNCLRCGSKLDTAESMEDPDAVPDAGSVSMCILCGNLAIFTGNGLELRPPTPEEQAEVLAMPEVRKMFRAFTSLWVSRTKGQRFPCGCVMGTAEKVFIFQPCSETCSVYAYVIEEGRKQGKPLSEIHTDRPELDRL